MSNAVCTVRTPMAVSEEKGYFLSARKRCALQAAAAVVVSCLRLSWVLTCNHIKRQSKANAKWTLIISQTRAAAASVC